MNTHHTDLVLLHGWGMNSAVWAGLPQGLQQRLTPHPIDLPGHAGTSFDADRCQLVDWADRCLAQAPEQALWLGWSLGGLVALQAALLAPKRVRALILITTTPRFVQAVDWRAAMAEETLAQFQQGLLDDPAGTLDRFLALQVRGSDAARATLRKLRAELAQQPAPIPGALTAGLDILREDDLRGPLPDIDRPSLWLFGQRDTLIPAGVAERIGLLMPNAQIQIIAGAAHAPFLSHADVVANEINAFLDRIAL
jgi:pimeloyl-[acyl-carrier protein] methyl ester esterase